MKKRAICLKGLVLFGLVFLFAMGLVGIFPTDDAVAQTRPALVRDVDNAARQPFAADSNLATFPFSSIEVSDTLLTVPAGKRAVIEHLSCINFLEAGNNFVRMELRYRLGGVSQTHQFVHTLVGVSLVGSIDIWSFSQPVRAYADPSTDISIFAIRRSSAGSGGIECQISGYYVDLP